MTQENNFTYPAMLNLTNKKCVLIGGGVVALRKLKTLTSAGASVTVIAPNFTEEILAFKGKVTLIEKQYAVQDLTGAFLVVAATDDFAINRQVTLDAPCLVNNITEPELSNFTVPSSFTKGDIHISIATGGVPAFTRKLKTYFASKLPASFVEFNAFLKEQRKAIKNIPSTSEERTKFWREALNEDVFQLLEDGKTLLAKEKFLHAVDCFRSQSQNGPR
ncbi:MAG: bifunctional precorrin-2 dehydrogenase/sirohydrochlorin ferrochelatase [Phascolarctobacterium sp.]|nr:bifunctional precorrin-2 dehydrogenase/sirohydrochlorin ferrochelatase [Phascolarctobacterium sp.]